VILDPAKETTELEATVKSNTLEKKAPESQEEECE